MKKKSKYLSKEQSRKLKSKLRKKEIVRLFKTRKMIRNLVIGFTTVAVVLATLYVIDKKLNGRLDEKLEA